MTPKKLKINNTSISIEHKPFIIAEMSGNHNHSLERALKITEAAKKSGVSALKLQTYTADTMTLNIKNRDFIISNKNSLWEGASLHDLYNKAHTPWEWHKPIMERANELGMICFSTPYDETSVEFLEKLNVPAYKIASFENNDLPLLRIVASTGKPLIISTGMATLEQIKEIVETIVSAGCTKYILLKCTSNYPSSPRNSNVLTIPHMRKIFKCEIGISDHTMGIGTSVAAISQGASLVEKHFTLKRSDGGVDSAFSLEPDEMSMLVIETERAWQSLGKVTYGPTDEEISSLKYKRSIYICQDMKNGELFTSENLRIIRPGLGLSPKYYEQLLGKNINKDVKMGTALSWDLVK